MRVMDTAELVVEMTMRGGRRCLLRVCVQEGEADSAFCSLEFSSCRVLKWTFCLGSSFLSRSAGIKWRKSS